MTFFKKPKKLMAVRKIVNQEETPSPIEKKIEKQNLKLDDLIDQIIKPFSSTQDLKTRWVTLPTDDSKLVLIFFDSIIDKSILQRQVLNPFFELHKEIGSFSFDKIAHLDFKKHTDFKEAQSLLLQANTLVFTEDLSCYYSIVSPIRVQRDIAEPDNEAVIRGSHEGFIESLTTNIALIRKRLKTSKLVVKYYTVGKETHTTVAVLFVDTIVNPELVKEVERRINAIEADSVMSPGNIEESLEEKPFSFFPQILSTERPDRVAAYLMEGKVALVYDTSPTAHIVPVNFFSFYQSPDDYNKRWMIGTFFRLIRLFSFFIAIGLPAVYIAIISFHFEVIPSGLILLIKSSLEDIPYPPLFEALLMELTIELIREASIRLPTRIGSTIAIVGGLVIGDAVVKAGLVSNLMIIVVAITAIAAYIVPSNEMSAAVRLQRFPFMVAAATLGFLGIIFGFMILFFHLCRLYTFGAPYFAPLAPLRLQNFRDTFIRAPFWKMDLRPKDARPLDENKENHSRKWDKS